MHSSFTQMHTCVWAQGDRYCNIIHVATGLILGCGVKHQILAMEWQDMPCYRNAFLWDRSELQLHRRVVETLPICHAMARWHGGRQETVPWWSTPGTHCCLLKIQGLACVPNQATARNQYSMNGIPWMEDQQESRFCFHCCISFFYFLNGQNNSNCLAFV